MSGSAESDGELVGNLFGGELQIRRQGNRVIIDSHLSGENHARLRQQLAEKAARGRQDADELIRGLRALVARVDPIALISALALAGTAGLPDVDDAPERFGREAAIEYVAGLALSVEKFGVERPNAQDVSGAFSAARQVMDSSALALIAGGSEAADPALAKAQFMFRLERIYDRMQGYATHLRQIADLVFEPLRSHFTSTLGFYPGDVPRVARAIFLMVNRRHGKPPDQNPKRRGPSKAKSGKEFRLFDEADLVSPEAAESLIFTADEIAAETGIAQTDWRSAANRPSGPRAEQKPLLRGLRPGQNRQNT